MSFGFPAYCTERYTPGSESVTVLQSAAHAAIKSLGWKLRSEQGEQITATTSISLWSWGERVELRFSADGSLAVTSKCSLPTQCLDWGKNKTNVRKFLEQLERHL